MSEAKVSISRIPIGHDADPSRAFGGNKSFARILFRVTM